MKPLRILNCGSTPGVYEQSPSFIFNSLKSILHLSRSLWIYKAAWRGQQVALTRLAVGFGGETWDVAIWTFLMSPKEMLLNIRFSEKNSSYLHSVFAQHRANPQRHWQNGAPVQICGAINGRQIWLSSWANLEKRWRAIEISSFRYHPCLSGCLCLISSHPDLIRKAKPSFHAPAWQSQWVTFVGGCAARSRIPVLKVKHHPIHMTIKTRCGQLTFALRGLSLSAWVGEFRSWILLQPWLGLQSAISTLCSLVYHKTKQLPNRDILALSASPAILAAGCQAWTGHSSGHLDWELRASFWWTLPLIASVKFDELWMNCPVIHQFALPTG